MKIVVTGGDSSLSLAIVAKLTDGGHDVVVVGAECSYDAEDDTVAALISNADQLIIVEPALPSVLARPGLGWLDACTRCVYNLLNACANAGVGRVCVLGSMEASFAEYPPTAGVLPNYMPRPTTSPSSLGPHLAEFSAREFALCGAVQVLVARLGAVVSEPPESGTHPHRWWITLDDAASALAAELEAGAEEPTALGRFGAAFITVNIGRGDGREIDPATGQLKPRWWANANGGDMAFLSRGGFKWPPPPPASPTPPPLAEPHLDAPFTTVCVLGASGMLGPDVARCLSYEMPDPGGEPTRQYALLLTDVTDKPAIRDSGQTARSDDANLSNTASTPKPADASVDIRDYAQVANAVADADVAVVCSVIREHPVLAFSVNCGGVYNACLAAVNAGHARLVNTGPKEVLAGHHYRSHHMINESVPPNPGLDIYSHTKGLGHEVSAVFAANHNLHVLTTLHGSFPAADFEERKAEGGRTNGDAEPGDGLPQAICSTFEDAARAVRACIEVPLGSLPSRLEAFFILPDVPYGVYSNEKAKALLGWFPRDTLEPYFTRADPAAGAKL
jgi:nucleoside-diphosphate-sugar epimerase